MERPEDFEYCPVSSQSVLADSALRSNPQYAKNAKVDQTVSTRAKPIMSSPSVRTFGTILAWSNRPAMPDSPLDPKSQRCQHLCANKRGG